MILSKKRQNKMLLGRLGKMPKGDKHYLWQGDKGSYATKHIWLKTHYGKATKCEKCNSKTAKRYEWANISGKYLRDRNDYIQLCPSCHRLMDRGNKCRNGHEFTPQNTWMREVKDKLHTKPYRVCKECQKNYSRNYITKLKKQNGSN